uniref:Dienelactone hydrolase family protein n=1 Tax=Phenylobacterium glaciei TaxID=2803784 RepID=A0A974S986_9CAUL|nr:dienelactone hydrolase family protein [Phenylobacterium glaciei]
MSRTEIALPTPEGDARAFVFKPDSGSGPGQPPSSPWTRRPSARPCSRWASAWPPPATTSCCRICSGAPAPIRPWTSPRPARATRRPGSCSPLRASTGAGRQMTDVKACLDYIDADPAAKPGKVGITGYCMGGSIALRAAGTYPDRIGAAASFHGGGMATDDERSPTCWPLRSRPRCWWPAPSRTAAMTRPRTPC